MTEKVEVTQEEFDWLEKCDKTQESIDYMIDTQALWLRPDSPMADWNVSKLARALLMGYELKLKKVIFKDGDMIFNEDQKKVGKISSIEAKNLNRYPERYKHIRHVTEEELAEWKEREFWEINGRKVWQLKEGDTLIERGDVHTCDVKFVEAHDEYGTLLVNGVQDECIESIEELKSKYEIFCFVEDRKDGRLKQ